MKVKICNIDWANIDWVNKNDTQIEKENNISRVCVGRIRKKLNKPKSINFGVRSGGKVRPFLKEINFENTVNEIAKQYHAHPRTIYKFRKEIGITRKSVNKKILEEKTEKLRKKIEEYGPNFFKEPLIFKRIYLKISEATWKKFRIIFNNYSFIDNKFIKNSF